MRPRSACPPATAAKTVLMILPALVLAAAPAYAAPGDYAPPVVCIGQFPADPAVSDTKKEMYVKEVESGISEWSVLLKQQHHLPRSEHWKWDIDIARHPSPGGCDVIIDFHAQPADPEDKLTLGTYQMVNRTGIISMYYHAPYSCETHRDDQYIYYGACRSEIDLATTEEFGSVFRHEFGHALGLGHSERDTSIMNEVYEWSRYKGAITPHDVSAAAGLYPDGFNYDPGDAHAGPRDAAPLLRSAQPRAPGAEQHAEPALIPEWVKDIFVWYGNGGVSDQELIGAIQYLVREGVIRV